MINPTVRPRSLAIASTGWSRCSGSAALLVYFVYPQYLAVATSVLIMALFAISCRSRHRLCRNPDARPRSLLRHRRLFRRPHREVRLERSDHRRDRGGRRRGRRGGHARSLRAAPRRPATHHGHARHQRDRVRGRQQGRLGSPAATTASPALQWRRCLDCSAGRCSATRSFFMCWVGCSSCFTCCGASWPRPLALLCRAFAKIRSACNSSARPCCATSSSPTSSAPAVAGIAGALFGANQRLRQPRGAESRHHPRRTGHDGARRHRHLAWQPARRSALSAGEAFRRANGTPITGCSRLASCSFSRCASAAAASSDSCARYLPRAAASARAKRRAHDRPGP